MKKETYETIIEKLVEKLDFTEWSLKKAEERIRELEANSKNGKEIK